MTNIKSKCCNAEVKAVCSDDFGDKEDRGGQTCHYECLKCGEACDIQTENTNIIEELSDLELSLEAEKDENGKIRASWVKEFILISLSQRDKEWEKKIWDMLFESFPSDMENFDLMLPDQAYRLLKTFWEKLKSLNK